MLMKNTVSLQAYGFLNGQIDIGIKMDSEVKYIYAGFFRHKFKWFNRKLAPNAIISKYWHKDD